MERGHQILAPVLHPRNRRAEPPCHPHRHHILDGQAELLPEGATHIRSHHPDPRLGNPDEVGDDRPHDMGRLDGRNKGDPAGSPVVGRDRSACFQGQGALASGCQVEPDDLCGSCENLIHPVGLDSRIHDHVVRNVVVDSRSPLARRPCCGGHMVTRLDVDVHLLGGILGFLRRARHHHRHGLADETNRVPRQDRLVDRSVVVPVQERANRSNIGQIM